MKYPFQVDDILIMHSPFTDDDTEVIFRGMLGEKAVVYNKVTGWQGAVPVDWLRKEKTK